MQTTKDIAITAFPPQLANLRRLRTTPPIFVNEYQQAADNHQRGRHD
jgi:hypothetical protein